MHSNHLGHHENLNWILRLKDSLCVTLPSYILGKEIGNLSFLWIWSFLVLLFSCNCPKQITSGYGVSGVLFLSVQGKTGSEKGSFYWALSCLPSHAHFCSKREIHFKVNASPGIFISIRQLKWEKNIYTYSHSFTHHSFNLMSIGFFFF